MRDVVDVQVRGPSLDVVYEYVKDQVGVQNDQINALDGKAGFILGSASLLTAGAASFQAVLSDSSSKLLANGLNPFVLQGITVLALVFYLLVVYSSYQAYKLRSYPSVGDVRLLRNKYEAKSVEATKGSLLDTMLIVIQYNHELIDDKANWLQRALILFVIEAIFTCLLIFVQLIIQNIG